MKRRQEDMTQIDIFLYFKTLQRIYRTETNLARRVWVNELRKKIVFGNFLLQKTQYAILNFVVGNRTFNNIIIVCQVIVFPVLYHKIKPLLVVIGHQ
jgi:hypothetical protein